MKKIIIIVLLFLPFALKAQNYIRVQNGSDIWLVNENRTDSTLLPPYNRTGFAMYGIMSQRTLDSLENIRRIARDSIAAVKLLLAAKKNSLGFTAVPDTRTVNGQPLSGNITIPGSAISAIPITSITNYTGYTLPVQALTSSPTDAQTIYFGMLPRQPTATTATSKIYIRKAGTIKVAEIYCYSGTAGTNEAWPISIRLNNTTDTQITSLSVATNERVWSNTGLSIAVVAGDYIEIKSVNPTWVNNPLTTIFSGYIYIE